MIIGIANQLHSLLDSNAAAVGVLEFALSVAQPQVTQHPSPFSLSTSQHSPVLLTARGPLKMCENKTKSMASSPQANYTD
jgi:hypothetical protein